MLQAGIGLMLTPLSQRSCPSPEWKWAADNACFANKWSAARWLSWIDGHDDPASAAFATVPDIVADHAGTLVRWKQWAGAVHDRGFKAAFVLQNGASTSTVPFDELDAVFIGGTTEWKLSDDARRIVDTAKHLNKWVHMGRVNSLRRLRIAADWGCDSVDGTFIAFAPDHNTGRMISMLDKLRMQPSLQLKHEIEL